MQSVYRNSFSLLLGAALLFTGVGLVNTLLGVRAGQEGFSNAAIGGVMSAYFLGYLCGLWLAPQVIWRVGHIRSFAAFAAALCVTILAYGLYVSPAVWAAVRFVSGICVLGLYLVIESWLGGVSENANRGALFGMYATLSLTAIGLGQLFMLTGELDSLRLFVIGAMAVSMAVVPVAVARFGNPDMSESTGSDRPFTWQKAPLGFVGAAASGVATGAFWGMGPVYFQRLGFDITELTMLMCGVIFGAAVLQWPVGYFSDRGDRRVFIAWVSAAAVALAAIMGSVGAAPPLELAGIGFLYGGAAFSLYGLSVAHVNDYIEPGERMLATESLLTLFGWGSFAGPLTAGLVMDWVGPQGLMWLFALSFATVGMYAAHRTRVRPPALEEKKSVFIPMVRSSQAMAEMDPRTQDETASGD